MSAIVWALSTIESSTSTYITSTGACLLARHHIMIGLTIATPDNIWTLADSGKVLGGSMLITSRMFIIAVPPTLMIFSHWETSNNSPMDRHRVGSRQADRLTSSADRPAWDKRGQWKLISHPGRRLGPGWGAMRWDAHPIMGMNPPLFSSRL